MRTIKYLVIHCTATPQTATPTSILRYWRTVLGWRVPGYHILITPDGKKHRMAPDETLCNGVKGFNSVSLHVSYIGGAGPGGRPLDNRTDAQKQALKEVIREWKARHPDAEVKGHRQFPNVTKACPSFEVVEKDFV